MFEIDFDFIDHRLRITTSEGEERAFALQPMTVASFCEQVMTALAGVGVQVEMDLKPCEGAAPMAGLPLAVVRDAYSHEGSSVGFWPGGEGFDAAFYSYAYPEEGYAQAPVRPAGAFYSPDLREFLLPCEAVRTSASPDEALMEFCESTYEGRRGVGAAGRRPYGRRDAGATRYSRCRRISVSRVVDWATTRTWSTLRPSRKSRSE